MTLLVSPLSSRNQFGDFLNERDLTGHAVEVGTHRGDFADVFLRHWKGRCLYCVDPWDNPPGYEYQATMLWGGGTREEDYEACVMRLAIHARRVQLMRALSVDAARQFHDESLDFVHLDGDHSLEGITADLACWWPKIRPGGVLAGHDIVMPGEKNGGWGEFIQPTVFRFAERYGVDIHLIVEEEGLPWSYHVTKEMP